MILGMVSPHLVGNSSYNTAQTAAYYHLVSLPCMQGSQKLAAVVIRKQKL